LLPGEPPDVPGLDIFGRSIYSEAVGGDYYDFIPLKDEDGRKRLAVVVGDVSGHGVVAALTMMSVRALLRSHAGGGDTLRPVMRAVNRHLAADASGGRFVTLVYMVVDPANRDVRWISAGHGPILFFDPRARSFEELPVHDIPLGVRADWPFHESDRDAWPDFGVIVLSTDGVWETRNAEGKAFGKDGLMRVMEESAHLTAREICDHVVDRLKTFAGATLQADDITLVVIKFLPKRT
jgi:sigma-B regulation protein RsbU (phosphoserine phosphatase)